MGVIEAEFRGKVRFPRGIWENGRRTPRLRPNMGRLKTPRARPASGLTGESESGDRTLVICRDPAEIDAARWNALLARQPSATPFVSLEYLRALHASASAVAETGWAPHFLLLEGAGELIAACPLYLKDHSYGEYVFDWAWADAYRRHGLDYYPKLTGAIPFTPVPGPRLLATTHEHRLLLLLRIDQPASTAAAWSASSRNRRWAEERPAWRAIASMPRRSINRCSCVVARRRGPGTGVNGIAPVSLG